MIHDYSKEWFPAMPVLEIRLGYPGESLSLGPLVGIVDTAADGSLVPLDLIERLDAPFVDDVSLRSQWGEWRRVHLFTVDIGIDSLRLPAIEIVGDDRGDEIILGRNVLNKLRLLLDGLAATTHVME